MDYQFPRIKHLDDVLPAIAIVVFAGLTAWDVQNLRNLYYELEGDERERAGVMGALSLYLNFVNIFTSLLQLFGERKDIMDHVTNTLQGQAEHEHS